MGHPAMLGCRAWALPGGHGNRVNGVAAAVARVAGRGGAAGAEPRHCTATPRPALPCAEHQVLGLQQRQF